MAVPRKKVSRSRRDKRRSHHALKPPGTVECTHCGERKRAHHVCQACGYYGDREVVEGASTA